MLSLSPLKLRCRFEHEVSSVTDSNPDCSFLPESNRHGEDDTQLNAVMLCQLSCPWHQPQYKAAPIPLRRTTDTENAWPATEGPLIAISWIFQVIGQYSIDI